MYRKFGVKFGRVVPEISTCTNKATDRQTTDTLIASLSYRRRSNECFVIDVAKMAIRIAVAFALNIMTFSEDFAGKGVLDVLGGVLATSDLEL